MVTRRREPTERPGERKRGGARAAKISQKEKSALAPCMDSCERVQPSLENQSPRSTCTRRTALSPSFLSLQQRPCPLALPFRASRGSLLLSHHHLSSRSLQSNAVPCPCPHPARPSSTASRVILRPSPSSGRFSARSSSRTIRAAVERCIAAEVQGVEVGGEVDEEQEGVGGAGWTAGPSSSLLALLERGRTTSFSEPLCLLRCR